MFQVGLYEALVYTVDSVLHTVNGGQLALNLEKQTGVLTESKTMYSWGLLAAAECINKINK